MLIIDLTETNLIRKALSKDLINNAKIQLIGAKKLCEIISLWGMLMLQELSDFQEWRLGARLHDNGRLFVAYSLVAMTQSPGMPLL